MGKYYSESKIILNVIQNLLLDDFCPLMSGRNRIILKLTGVQSGNPGASQAKKFGPIRTT